MKKTLFLLFLMPLYLYKPNILNAQINTTYLADYYIDRKEPKLIINLKNSHITKKIPYFKNEILIKSVMRSGTNLTMAILTFLTAKPCLWSHQNKWSKYDYLNRPQVKTKPKKLPILGSHNVKDFIGMENNFLVVTLRDYREIFFRNSKELRISEKTLQDYYDNLALFDRWDKNKKILVHYEELMKNPIKVISEFSRLFNIDQKRKSALIAQYEDFKQKIKSQYNTHMKSINNTSQIDFHQKKIPSKELRKLDIIMKNYNPQLFNKYLQKYAL